jgi:hypothetical protein
MDYCGLVFLRVMRGREPPRAPLGRVQTGIASFCKAPQIAEQLRQQQREDGQMGKMMMRD